MRSNNQNFGSFLPLNSFSSVGEGETANVALETGGVIYDNIHVEYPNSALLDAEFDVSNMQVRLNLNGEDIVDVPAADLVTIEGYEGNAEILGYFTISYRELIAKTADGDFSTGLVTMPGDTLTLEIDIGGTGINAVITLKAFADTRARPKGVVRTVIPKIRVVPISTDVSGQSEITNMNKGPVYKRVHFKSASMTDMEIEADQVKLWKLSKARNEYVQKRYGRVPQAGVFTFDPIVDGYAKLRVLLTAGLYSLIFRPTMSAAGSMNAIVESVWPEPKAGEYAKAFG